MKALTILYMLGCPYCRSAKQALAELQAETPAYARVDVTWIDENRDAAAQAYQDYWYVPTVYLGQEKLYEASPTENYAAIKAQVQRCLDRALAEP